MIKTAQRLITSLGARPNYRSVGDAARDKGLWSEAEAAYRAHLDENPADFDIWVQFGHSLKEQQKFGPAEDAYRRGLALRPEDADANLQLGHVLKLLGRNDAAESAYLRSYELSRSSVAFTELTNLAGEPPKFGTSPPHASAALGLNTLYVEVEDLLNYLLAHKTVSGIQRVQAEIVRYMSGILDTTDGPDPCFVLNPTIESKLWTGDGQIWVIRTRDLLEVISYAASAYVDHERLRRLIYQTKEHAVARTPTQGQTYLILGSFWGTGGLAANYLPLKKKGLKFGAYIYDLIPITHPEYCDAGLAHDFMMSFSDGLALFDFILTISEYTAREVDRYIKKWGLFPVPVHAVPLAHSSDPSSDRETDVSMQWSGSIGVLQDRPFVLMVSTIEARKNHAFLVAAWKQFLEEGLDPPDLVFVGRQGWRVADLMEQLRATHYLNGRVHTLHDLSDLELLTLYRGCLFTVFPSYVEGWGLPVGESLAHGKPCLASSTSSVPEVGGDLVDYMDPLNFRSAIEALRRLTFDESYRERRTMEVREGFKPRLWSDVGAEITAAVTRFGKEPVVSRAPEPVIPAGIMLRLNQYCFGKPLPQDYAKRPIRLLLTQSWYSIEEFGCWLRGAGGLLRFQTSLPPDTACMVYLILRCAPWTVAENKAVIRVGSGQRKPVDLLAASPNRGAFLVRVPGKIDKDGTVSVRIDVSGEVPREHDGANARKFVLGLDAIGYAATDDYAARTEIIEDVVFENLTPYRYSSHTIDG